MSQLPLVPANFLFKDCELAAAPGPLCLAPTGFTTSVYQELVRPSLNLLMLLVSTASCSNGFYYLIMH